MQTLKPVLRQVRQSEQSEPLPTLRRCPITSGARVGRPEAPIRAQRSLQTRLKREQASNERHLLPLLGELEAQFCQSYDKHLDSYRAKIREALIVLLPPSNLLAC